MCVRECEGERESECDGEILCLCVSEREREVKSKRLEVRAIKIHGGRDERVGSGKEK